MAGEPPFLRVAGGWVQAWTRDQLIDSILTAAATGRRYLAGYHNLHSLALLQRSSDLASFYDACSCIVIDGMPLVGIGLLQGHRLRPCNRLTGLDWIPTLIDGASGRGLSWLHVGSPDGVAAAGAQRMLAAGLISRLPTHRMLSGYFDDTPGSPDWRGVLDRINDFAPQIITVGMGQPRQERWIMSILGEIRRPAAVLAMGATLEYHAELQSTPPRLLGQLGLEWLWRLASSPRRLAHRYLVEPWSLAPTLQRELTRRRGWRRHGRD